MQQGSRCVFSTFLSFSTYLNFLMNDGCITQNFPMAVAVLNTFLPMMRECMTLDGIDQYWMVMQQLVDGIELIQVTIEWLKTPKPISGIGMDGWMDSIRVVGGIQSILQCKKNCGSAADLNSERLCQQTTVHQNWRELQITFPVAHCGESRFSQEKCRIFTFCLLLSLDLYFSLQCIFSCNLI